MDTILVIQNDALENLKGHPERTPGIVLQKRDEGRTVESQRIAEGIFFNRLPSGNACRWAQRGGLSTRPSHNFVQGTAQMLYGFVWIKGEFASAWPIFIGTRSDCPTVIVKMGGKNVRSIVDQFQVDCARWQLTAPGQAPKAAEKPTPVDFEDHIRSLGIIAPDITQANVKLAETVCDSRANFPVIARIRQISRCDGNDAGSRGRHRRLDKEPG